MPLYNNGYPASYQNPYLYQQSAQQQPNSIIWVQGEAGAKSYLVAPNSTVQLWDSEAQTIYLKSADASGMPSIKTLDYTIREAAVKPTEPLRNEGQYITKDDLKAVYEQISGLKTRVDKLTRRMSDEPVISDDE